MTDERKLELFEGMINYVQDCTDRKQCVEILNMVGITKTEAKELDFFDFIVEQIN